MMHLSKVVSFRDNQGISHELVQRLAKNGRRHGINGIFPFSIDKIVVAEWVHLKCRYGCRNYNTNWCCPPATPNPDKVRSILSEYRLGLLLVGNRSCSEFYLDNARKRAGQVRCWKGTVAIERILFLEGYYKAFSLVGECCALCKTCAYPEDCRFPQEKRPSLESFSIDVIRTLKNLGKTAHVAAHTRENYTYYGVVLVE